MPHFTKDEDPFARFALESLHVKKDVRKLNKWV